MPVLPGGKIISGVGGRIWISALSTINAPGSNVNTRTVFQNLGGPNPVQADGKGIPYLDILQWSISKTNIWAEVPHSGCVGGVTRRLIGQTWRYSASLPLDQKNFPDSLLIQDKFAIAFYLGDVLINPEAVYMRMSQVYYYSPRACVGQINPVLNAAGDVIRVNISGEESCRLFLVSPGPSTLLENDFCDRYTSYLFLHQGWL